MDDGDAQGWQESEWGVQVLHRPAVPPIAMTEAGLPALDCIAVPLAIMDPSTCEVVWANATLLEVTTPEELLSWTGACAAALAAGPSPLRTVLEAVRRARSEDGSVDVFVPMSADLPTIGSRTPRPWTLHCHSVTLLVQPDARDVVTMQAPSLIEPPWGLPEDSDTATDRVVCIIDRILQGSPRPPAFLHDLRARVLDGRMNEPIFSNPVLADRAFSWETGASLAMMLGLPFRSAGAREAGDNSLPDGNGAV